MCECSNALMNAAVCFSYFHIYRLKIVIQSHTNQRITVHLLLSFILLRFWCCCWCEFIAFESFQGKSRLNTDLLLRIDFWWELQVPGRSKRKRINAISLHVSFDCRNIYSWIVFLFFYSLNTYSSCFVHNYFFHFLFFPGNDNQKHLQSMCSKVPN